MITSIKEIPMKCFRVTFYDKTFDIFTPDIYDVSSIVNITDENGDQVPYDQWETFGNVLLDSVEHIES
jgi:hypothetical protein